jgi:phage/plasmid-like protein (TIGR03299 family)
MNLLDTILENHGRPVILSEQHDLDQINVDTSAIESGIRSRAGVWDAREYGLTEVQVAERLAAANTPAAREAVIADLRQRAIARAGYDTSNGRVNAAFANRPAWSGLGVVVQGTMKTRDAMTLGGVGWLTEKVPMSYAWNGLWNEADDTFALVRTDTGAKLCTVGSGYEDIQNPDAFEFLDSVVGEFGAEYESVGSVHGGKKVWLLAHLPRHSFRISGDKDEVKSYVMFFNPHDYSGKAFAYPTTERVECANTMRVSLTKDKDKGLGIAHRGNIKRAIESTREVLGLSVRGFETYREQAEFLARKPLEINHFCGDVLDKCLDVTEAQCKMGADVLAAAIAKTQANLELLEKSFQRKIDRRAGILDDILERYESGTCGADGTAWKALNAVTEYADHGKTRYRGTPEERSSRHLESVLGGERDDLKQTALQTALSA